MEFIRTRFEQISNEITHNSILSKLFYFDSIKITIRKKKEKEIFLIQKISDRSNCKSQKGLENVFELFAEIENVRIFDKEILCPSVYYRKSSFLQ